MENFRVIKMSTESEDDDDDGELVEQLSLIHHPSRPLIGSSDVDGCIKLCEC